MALSDVRLVALDARLLVAPRVLEKAGFAMVGEAPLDEGRVAWRFRILDGALPA